MLIKPPSATTGKAAHTPAGGVAPRNPVPARGGHAIHQHQRFHQNTSLKSVRGQFK